MEAVLTVLAAIGLPTGIVIFIVVQWDKIERILGRVWSAISAVGRFGDKTAVAMRVQGDINTARAAITRHAPDGLLDSRIKIKWQDVEAAKALLRDGEVVVCMRRSKYHEENMAHALMAFLPKAVVPRARRYVDKPTMRAADLTLAKAILSAADQRPGALDVFFEEHLDPAREDEELRQRIEEVDEIDLHGWLLRMMLPEFRQLGDQLYPGEVDRRCAQDAAGFTRWLYALASREPGSESAQLAYEGRYIRVAVVLVARRAVLLERGTDPYRKVAKRLIYSGEYDAVYLMGRDDNMDAVRAIFERLREDGRVASSSCHQYKLRPDFKKRKLPRDHAIIACLRPHQGDARHFDPGEDLPEVEIERYDPTDLAAEGTEPVAAPVTDDKHVARALLNGSGAATCCSKPTTRVQRLAPSGDLTNFAARARRARPSPCAVKLGGTAPEAQVAA